MAFALVLVSAALVVCLYLLLMGRKDAPVAVRSLDGDRPAITSSQSMNVDRSSGKAEVELEKKRRELDDVKKQFSELKDELKTVKKKVFEQKEAGKADGDLIKARAEVERQASIQLEHTRMELSQALEQVAKLKGDEGGKGRRSVTAQAAPAPVAAQVAAAEVPATPVAAAPVVQKVIRELSEGDKERINRAEAASAKDRQRIADLEKAMKNSKGRGDAATHQLKIARQEGTLAKDKFRAIERRVNRLMLERDLMVRAIKDLETKSGIRAERVELTADEVAASDQHVNANQAEEDKVAEDAQVRHEASEATTPAVNQATVAAVSAVPPAASAPEIPSTPVTPPPAQA